MESLIEKLLRLKRDRNAVILAHYYQDSSVQDVADFLGDSLALSQEARKTDAEVILFCGVHFMAETAKILNPERTVIVPDLKAGCSLADSARAPRFETWVNAHPGHIIISYINCSAEVKAMSDVICTSSNAVRIVESVPKNLGICFAPDKYLGAHVIRKTGRDMALWDGSCQVHESFSEVELIGLIKKYPEAKLLAHPECPENILRHADYIGSTNGIIGAAVKMPERQFIIATEPGIIHFMQKQAPDKEFIPVPNLNGCASNECPHMRLNTLEKMVSALENLSPEVTMPADIRLRALKPLERMLELS